jgi:3-oxoacyl-[acyl-carrier-protein] synthase-1
MNEKIVSKLGKSEKEIYNYFPQPLLISKASICSPLGYDFRSATCAMRANMNFFAPSNFQDENGSPIKGSFYKDLNVWGAERLKWSFDQVLHELQSSYQLSSMNNEVIIVIGPEKNRPGSDLLWSNELKNLIANNHNLHAASKLFNQGKTGIGECLSYISKLFTNDKTIQRCWIIGVDSLFTSGNISYLIQQGRLKTSKQSDGLIPGEAAAGVLIEPYQEGHKGLVISGLGVDIETASINNFNENNTAIGLTKAIRQAAHSAKCPIANGSFHLSAISGESWYFKEAVIAMTKAIEFKVPQFVHQLIADKLGEIGAASGPAMLGYLLSTMGRRDSIGRQALMHLSGDNGSRVAAVIHWK